MIFNNFDIDQNPIFAAVSGELAQLARALAWHARGRRFDSDILHALKPPSGGFFNLLFRIKIIEGACRPESIRGRGRRFDSDILHALKPPSGGFFIGCYLNKIK